MKKFYDKFVRGCIVIIKEHYDKPADISKEIDKWQTAMMKDGEKLAKKHMTLAWYQGLSFAELSMKKAGYGTNSN